VRAKPLRLIDVELAEYRWQPVTCLTEIVGAVNLVAAIDFGGEVRPLIPSPSPARGEGNYCRISSLRTHSLSPSAHLAPLSRAGFH